MVLRQGERVVRPLGQRATRALPVVSQRVWRGVSDGVLGVGAVAAVGVVVVWVLVGRDPGWWPASGVGPSSARARLARAVDNGVWTEFTAVRPMEGSAAGRASEPWRVSLSGESAGAWLNEELPGWLAAAGVDVPKDARFDAAFEQGQIRLGVSVPGSAVVGVWVRPRLDGAGLWMTAQGASVGRLGVPAGVVLGRGSGQLGRALRGEAPLLADGALRLPDGRRVRVMAINAEGGRLAMTLRTEGGWGQADVGGNLRDASALRR